MKTLKEKIKACDPEMVVALKNRYGVFWVGKAKFVFGAVTNEAWYGDEVEVIANCARVGE